MVRTIREAHRWAFSFLQQNGGQSADDARFIAERLLRHLLGWDRARFFAALDEPFPEELWPMLRRLIEEKGKGVPLQYLVGSQEFYGREFRVSPHVLIPRPETECLVEAVLERADALWQTAGPSVVDVGCGSGAIAITLAKERSSWDVTAIDLSKDALRTARDNAARHKVERRIRFLQGDLLTPLVERKERVDIVVSNPPYIPSRDLETLAVEVREHEPRLALDGGEDGLNLYRRLAAMLKDVVKRPKGIVALEVGAGQSREVASLLHQSLPHGKIDVVKDLAGIDRVVVLYWTC